jgi:hypothetical protein
MAGMTDEQMRARLAEAKPYTVVILKRGPNYHSEDARSVIWEHGRRNMELQGAGLLPIVCPVVDDTDVSGVGILTVDAAAAAEIMNEDPGVRAGVFSYDLHDVRSFPGSTLP